MRCELQWPQSIARFASSSDVCANGGRLVEAHFLAVTPVSVPCPTDRGTKPAAEEKPYQKVGLRSAATSPSPAPGFNIKRARTPNAYRPYGLISRRCNEYRRGSR